MFTFRNSAILALAMVAGATVAARAADVTVGVALPLTGPVATYAGVTAKNGVEIAVQMVNAKKELGENTLKAQIEDIASDKAQAITVVNRLIKSDNVPIIIGPTTTVFAAAVAPIANTEQTPILTIGLAPSINKSGPFAFKMFQNPERSIHLFTSFAAKKAGVKNFIGVYNRDSDAYVAMHKETLSTFKNENVTLLSEESTLVSETDFTALAAKIVNAKPDAIFFNCIAEQAANIMIQLRRAGLPESTKIFGFGSGFYPQYPRIGGKAVDGTYILSHYYAQLDNPANKEFAENYRKAYNSDPDEFAAMAYTAVRVAAAAIAKVGPDRKKIRDEIAAIKNAPSVLGAGTFTFDENRSPEFGAAILQLKDGKPVLQSLTN